MCQTEVGDTLLEHTRYLARPAEFEDDGGEARGILAAEHDSKRWVL